MHIKIRVWYGDDPQWDGSYQYRLDDGLPLLKKVMSRSAKLFEIRELTEFDDVGGIARIGREFIVDEFYEGIVIDFIRYSKWDGVDRWDEFKRKYKVEAA